MLARTLSATHTSALEHLTSLCSSRLGPPMIPTKREPPMTRRLPPAWSKGRFSEERVVGVVGGGFLYLSPLGVYNIHVTKLYILVLSCSVLHCKLTVDKASCTVIRCFLPLHSSQHLTRCLSMCATKCQPNVRACVVKDNER